MLKTTDANISNNSVVIMAMSKSSIGNWGLEVDNNSNDDMFAQASVKPDGGVQNSDDMPRGVARIDIGNHVYWFTTDYRFDENGNDFWIVIKYFGFAVRSTAGNKMGGGREFFTAEQAKSAQKRIVEYFADSEEKEMFPFNMTGCRFLGVIFEGGWILVRG